MIRNRMRRTSFRAWLTIWVCGLLLSACARSPEASSQATPTTLAPQQPTLQTRTFEALWSAVYENYVYGDFHGVDWQSVRDQYRTKVEAGLSADEFNAVIRAMLAELPPGAVIWQTRAERIQQEAQDPVGYEGIGAFVALRAQPEPHIVLLSVIPGSPAERAGLKEHDSILAIDGVAIQVEEDEDAVVSRIRGPAGSRVSLRVRSPGRPARTVDVTRGRLVASDQLRFGLISSTGIGDIGYLLFPPVGYEALAEEAAGSLEALTADRRLGGLILDLRIATSGDVWPLTDLLTMFADGELGEIYSRAESDVLSTSGQDSFGSQTLPLAIIVGPHTRGSPEVFAAALQASGRATVIGLATPGLLEGETGFSLPDGSQAFVDTLSYRTPDGREIGLTGVQPNVRVDADWDEVTDVDDPALDAAVTALLDRN